MNIPWFRRLGTQFTLTIMLVLSILIAIVTVLLLRGFQQTGVAATAASQQGLETQGQTALRTLVEREARLRTAELEKAATASRQAAQIFSDSYAIPTIMLTGTLDSLTRGPLGNQFDANPNRPADLVIFSSAPAAPDSTPEFQRAQLLTAVFPVLLAETAQTVAIYYMNPQELILYYPVIGLHDIVPADIRMRESIFYTIATPEHNPTRGQRWTPPYVDPAGNGLLITASTPIYDQAIFHGVVSVDLSLVDLVAEITTLHPTDHGYAMLLDRDSRLIAAPASALSPFFKVQAGPAPLLESTLGLPLQVADGPAMAGMIASMQAGKSGVEQAVIDGQTLVVAYAPLPNVQWTLVLVAPLEEVTSESQDVAAAIDTGTDDTIRTTVLALGLLTVLASLVVWGLIRRLTRPLVALVAGTQAVADHQENVTLAVTSRNELGVLAHSFNQMAAEIGSARHNLRQINATLEETVHQRTGELEDERRSLQHALAELRQLSTTVAGLTTPMIPVLRGVMVVPIVGTLTAERVNQLQSDMLDAVQIHRAHTMILDLTGLHRIDSDIVDRFIASIQSLHLLGAKPILVGIHAELAQQLVLSGSTLHTVETQQTLEVAIQQAILRHA
jgi:anti-anti-sigma regulatory factor/HAMP domain-containing protein